MEAREKSLLRTEAFAPALFTDPRYGCLLERDPALVKQAILHLQGLWVRLSRVTEAGADEAIWPPTSPTPADAGTAAEEDLDPVERLLRETEGLSSSAPTTPTKDIACSTSYGLGRDRTSRQVHQCSGVLGV